MIEYAKIGTAIYKVISDGEVCGRVFFDADRGTWSAEDGFAPVTGFDTRTDAAEWIIEDHLLYLDANATLDQVAEHFGITRTV